MAEKRYVVWGHSSEEDLTKPPLQKVGITSDLEEARKMKEKVKKVWAVVTIRDLDTKQLVE